MIISKRKACCLTLNHLNSSTLVEASDDVAVDKIDEDSSKNKTWS